MAKKVKFNVKCRVQGNPVSSGDVKTIDDPVYKALVGMQRLGVPYVELIEDHEAEPKPKKRGRPKKETATVEPDEKAVDE